jgi:hypothetical protein
MSTLLVDFIEKCERFGVQNSKNSKNSEFVKWSRAHFPEVTDFSLTKEKADTLVNGLTRDGKTLFTLRHVPVLAPPAMVNGHYVYQLWEKHCEQRIHVSEFQDFFGNWIRAYFPQTKYVYINAYQPNKWVVSLDKEYSFEVVPC